MIVEISIHALREESDSYWLWATPLFSISIHALREESDLAPLYHPDPGYIFLSTLSVRRATAAATARVDDLSGNFYPRSP